MHSSALVLWLGKFFESEGARQYLEAAQQSAAELQAEMAQEVSAKVCNWSETAVLIC
jgi:hypothetical protein